jgi:hypothetical protein
MIKCLHCGAETSNGLALCDLCQRAAVINLEFLPVYFRNLARWRPGRAGSRPVPGSRVLYDGEVRGDGTGDRISDRLDETANGLIGWARMLATTGPTSRGCSTGWQLHTRPSESTRPGRGMALRGLHALPDERGHPRLVRGVRARPDAA